MNDPRFVMRGSPLALVTGLLAAPAALVAAADGALYRAKREGRNRVAQATA
jgi:PleD family two-component response regulator